MARLPLDPLQVRLRQARRRLIGQSILNRLGLGWGIALALAIVWFLLAPVVWPAAPRNSEWIVLGSAVGLATVVALWSAIRSAPNSLHTALAVDQRFELSERVTTAIALRPEERSSPAGQALLADANDKLAPIAIKGKFPVRIGWRALFLPAQAAAIALLALYPPPMESLLAGTLDKKDGKAVVEADKPAPQVPPTVAIRKPADRAKKSEQLKALEEELENLYNQHVDGGKPEKNKPENVRERQEQIASAEAKLQKREKEMVEKLQRLQEQMQNMTDRNAGESRPDGPAKEFEEALSKGDLQKAKEEMDELRKKARDKKLTPKDAQDLKRELEKMEERVDRLTREQEEKKQKLKDLIEQAKKEKRDADSLERELNAMEKEQKEQMAEEMKNIAKALKGAKQALDMNDFDGVADQLGQVSKELSKVGDQLDDLDDLEEHLQNLKEMRRQACKECEGGDGDGDGEGKDGLAKKGQGGKGDGDKPGGDGDNATGRANGATGRRAENKDANSRQGEEKRVRGLFDAKGRKSYAGATTGPAFKKASTVEMAGDIRQAVQDAPEAVEVQRLPKAAREMVKEYFEKLGGQVPPKK